jgi:hypothetical protein
MYLTCVGKCCSMYNILLMYHILLILNSSGLKGLRISVLLFILYSTGAIQTAIGSTSFSTDLEFPGFCIYREWIKPCIGRFSSIYHMCASNHLEWKAVWNDCKWHREVFFTYHISFTTCSDMKEDLLLCILLLILYPTGMNQAYTGKCPFTHHISSTADPEFGMEDCLLRLWVLLRIRRFC